MDLDTFLASAEELLGIPSTADRPRELHRALDFVLDFVGPGFTVERFESNGKPSALVYPGPVRSPFRVVFNAHLDVVPAPAEQFRPRREGALLYARGAQDMKISGLVLAQVFRETAAAVPFPIALQLVTDEEVGGRNGTGHQLDQGVRADFAVIGEHSGLRIVTDSKGMLNARLHAEGQGAHGAYPWLGDNALVKLIRSVENVLGAYPLPAEEAWSTTVNLARIETTNIAFNQIPAEAVAWLDIRFPPHDSDFDGRTPEEIAKHLTSLCLPGVVAAVDYADPPHAADRASTGLVTLRRAIEEQGFSAEFLRKHGAADSRFYYRHGIDAVICGVAGHGQHGPDEYADTTTIEPYHRALTRFLQLLAEAG